MFYKLLIAYDGTAYYGWQAQPDRVTVTGSITSCFSSVFKKECHLLGSSRTDAGVHALGQVARLETDLIIDPEFLKKGLNNRLPSDIIIRSVEIADERFNPRYDVVEKVYYYHIFNNRPLPFFSRYGLAYKRAFDSEKFKEALSVFVGTHDFRSFCTGDEKSNTIRTVNDIQVHYFARYQAYRVEVYGKSFLQHMIRRIIGASLDVASSPTKSLQDLKKALAEKNPRQLFPSASSEGLVLARIQYTE
jgi:tRNA pseudouridine38-40 synthase